MAGNNGALTFVFSLALKLYFEIVLFFQLVRTVSRGTMKLHQRFNFYQYTTLLLPNRVRSRLKMLYLLVSLHVALFLIVYHRLILIKPSLFQSFDSDRNQMCPIPRLDPWDQTISKSLHLKALYRCPTHKQNLIDVINHTQLVINQQVNRTSFSGLITHCVYFKVGRDPEEKSFRDWSYTLSEPILITNGRTESILDADFVLTRCYNDRTAYFNGAVFW